MTSLGSSESALSLNFSRTSKLAMNRLIPDFLGDRDPIPFHACPDHWLLKFLQRTEFKKLSPLHEVIYLVPNERYLAFLLWGILRTSPKKTLISRCSAPPEIAAKLDTLLTDNKNPYWACYSKSTVTSLCAHWLGPS